MDIPKQFSILVALTKFLTVFISRKIIAFSYLDSINFNDNFKDNFMRENVNETALKTKTLNICALEPNWKLIHDDLILSHKNDSHDVIPSFNQHWLY